MQREAGGNALFGSTSRRLINFDKYVKTVRIIQEMQKFQRPYNLVEVPELQEYLKEKFENSKSGGNPDVLYRQSLGIEPREEPLGGGGGGGLVKEGGVVAGSVEADDMFTLEQVLLDLQ